MPDSDSHQKVSAAAAAHLRAASHSLKGAVSSHKLSGSLSFPQLGAFLEVVKTAANVKADQVFVGTVDSNVSVSVVFNYKRPQASEPKKKRRKDEEDAIDALDQKIGEAVARVRTSSQKTNGSSVDEEVLNGATQILQSLLLNLKGPAGEEVVESWGLSASSPTAASIGRPRLILSVRLSAGMPVPVSTLRRSLGRSFVDGMVGCNQDPLLSFALPITEQGAVSEREGQKSLILHTSVAAV